MRITVDTNILIRAVVRDDAEQARRAEQCLREATVIAVTLPCLCEFVWVLRRLYRFQPAEISAAIRALLAVAAVETNRPAVEAGLAMLDAGGDFADGVIAQEGAWLGGSIFLSFDQTAVTLLTAQGREARGP
jgi:predicted nucleic-acid-binding protein